MRALENPSRLAYVTGSSVIISVVDTNVVLPNPGSYDVIHKSLAVIGSDDFHGGLLKSISKDIGCICDYKHIHNLDSNFVFFEPLLDEISLQMSM